MSALSLKNGKGANKPFRSPFANLDLSRDDCTRESQQATCSNSPKLESKISTPRRLVFQGTSASSPFKRLKPAPQQSVVHSNSDISESEISNSLEALTKRIQQKEKCLNDRKRSLLYRQKNNPQELEAEIEKWTATFQTAIQDLRIELENKHGKPFTVMEILATFGIDPNVVRYNADDDTFT